MLMEEVASLDNCKVSICAISNDSNEILMWFTVL